MKSETKIMYVLESKDGDRKIHYFTIKKVEEGALQPYFANHWKVISRTIL